MKSKKKQINKKMFYSTITIIILALSFIGIQVPDFISDFLDVPKTEQAKQSTTNFEGKNAPIDLGQATFTAKELSFTEEGWIEYHELDDLARATGAEAVINLKMIGTGSKANQNIRPPGFISGLDPHGHSRGHLIGNQFGGTGNDERNLVTLYQNPVNTPYMTNYENMIRSAVDQGDTVLYRVTPVYYEEELMPVAVELEAQSLTADGTINFYVQIPNKKEENNDD